MRVKKVWRDEGEAEKHKDTREWGGREKTRERGRGGGGRAWRDRSGPARPELSPTFPTFKEKKLQ